jgi:hypothetical protein
MRLTTARKPMSYDSNSKRAGHDYLGLWHTAQTTIIFSNGGKKASSSTENALDLKPGVPIRRLPW